MTIKKQADVTFDKGITLEKATEFEKAKTIYEDLFRHVTDQTVLKKIRFQMEDIDDLIEEKAIYQRIDENAKRVLTEIGINIIENQYLMDLLMEADAVDFDNETALFIPLKRDYIDHCLEQMPRRMPADPGMNTFGTGATPPLLGLQVSHLLRPEAVPVLPI
jgi:trimethylamine--corrinoid protein Co-methyltransferase